MEYNKQFFEKVFSTDRMERYFSLYPDDELRAIAHYECILMLAESLYVSLSVLEVTLRNALSRELETMTGRKDWYAIFPTTAGLRSLNRYITEASQHIHNESICWNLARVEEIHDEMLKVVGWMNRDLPEWVVAQERFEIVCAEIRKRMNWTS